MALGVLSLLSIAPTLGLSVILGQSIRQLQSPTADLDWRSLLGDHVARWLLPIVRNTVFESGVPAHIQLVFLPPALLIVGFLYVAIKASTEYLSERFSESVALRTRVDIMTHFFRLPFDAASHVPPSQISTLVGTDVQEIKLGVRRLSGLVPGNALQSITLLAWLVVLDTKLFALFVAVLAPSAIAIRYLSKTLKRLAKEGLHLQSEVLGLFLERVRGWETIRVFRSIPAELTRFRDKNMALFKRLRRTARASGIGAPTVEWFATIAGAVVLVLALRRLAIDELSSSVLTCFLVAMGQLSGTLQSLTRHYASLKRARASMDRVVGFLQLGDPQTQAINAPAPSPNTKEPLGPIDSIELENISVHDAASNRILVGHLNLRLKKGDFCVIMGPSGSGKSTLLRVLAGLQQPATGVLKINGIVPDSGVWHHCSRELSFLAQEPFLTHGDLADNLLFPQPASPSKTLPQAQTRIQECLTLAALHKPHTTMVSELSGGEKQRLALARAVYRGSSLWFMDESTSALDAASEAKFLETLADLAKEHIVVFVTHRQAVAARATQSITLKPSSWSHS